MNENNKFLRYAVRYDGKGKLFPLIMPNLCPICMSQEIAGEQKLRDSTTGRKYIFTPLCSEHYHFYRKQLLKFFGILLIPTILILIIFLVTRNSIILIISLFLNLFLCFFYLFKFMSRIMKAKNIRDYLDIKYTKTIITVLIKHSDWAEAFKKLNQCEFYELDEQLIKELDPIIIKLIITFLIWVGFSIFMAIISPTIIQQEWLRFFFFSFIAIGFFTIISLLIYYSSKQEGRKIVREISGLLYQIFNFKGF